MSQIGEHKTDGANGGLDSPIAREIIKSMKNNKPKDTLRFLDIFAHKQRERAECRSIADLAAAEASINATSNASTQDPKKSSTITHPRERRFEIDLNEEITMDDAIYEGYAESNNPEIQAHNEAYPPANERSESHAGTSSAHSHQTTNEEEIDRVLDLEPPSSEEKEMDRMFANDNYPTIQQITEAQAPELGMEFDSRGDAFFFFAVYARRMGFAIKKDSSYESKRTNTIMRQAFSCNRCPLIKDEKADTFTWLFKEFIAAMGNRHPETIITDQDVAMSIAISEAMPYTVHRYCNFHIGKNMKEKLPMFFAIRGTFHEELRAVIRNSFTPEEFETGWQNLMEKHNAHGEPHLDRIFSIREQWVPAYFMDKFFLFTSSTSRSESTNSLFKSYVKRKDSTATFFKQYLLIQEKKQADLDRLREKSEFKESSNWGYNPIEREAMKIYTDPIYGRLAEEMKKTTAYNLEVVVLEQTFRVIRVAGYRNAEFPRLTYMVQVSLDRDVYSCSCCKMARDGITKLKKFVVNDTIERMKQHATVIHKKRRIDDPLPKQFSGTDDRPNGNDIDANLNEARTTTFSMHTANDNEVDEQVSLKDPPQTGNPGFNLGERPRNCYEKAAGKLKKKQPRLCGLCRLLGHKRPACPDRNKVGLNGLKEI
ncbi:hypothetical protein ACQ4PT_057544 [Festuca glaucescens]